MSIVAFIGLEAGGIIFVARARPGPKKMGSGSARARKNRLDTALLKKQCTYGHNHIDKYMPFFDSSRKLNKIVSHFATKCSSTCSFETPKLKSNNTWTLHVFLL